MYRNFGCAVVVIALAGCSQLPVQKRDLSGGIIEQGPADFAVFIDADAAMAVRMGTGALQQSEEPLALRAIERVTGCQVISGSVSGDAKTVEARVHCDVSAGPGNQPAVSLGL